MTQAIPAAEAITPRPDGWYCEGCGLIYPTRPSPACPKCLSTRFTVQRYLPPTVQEPLCAPQADRCPACGRPGRTTHRGVCRPCYMAWYCHPNSRRGLEVQPHLRAALSGGWEQK